MLTLIIRTFRYFEKGWQFFMIDFCIYANLLTLYYVWFDRMNCSLFQIIFAFNMGPLLWAIVVMRNSLVYHSLDK